MRLLLDTHVLLAVVDDRMELLAGFIRDVVLDPGASVHASVASLWEIAIKVRVGKLAIRQPLPVLPETIKQYSLELIPIDHHHVLTPVDPEPATRDPFDRLLLAQCQIENLQLVTVDRVLKIHPLAWRPA